jgi:hypothetical protein
VIRPLVCLSAAGNDPARTTRASSRKSDHRAHHCPVRHSLHRFTSPFQRIRRRHHRLNIQQPPLDQPDVTRHIAHHIQAALLARVERASPIGESRRRKAHVAALAEAEREDVPPPRVMSNACCSGRMPVGSGPTSTLGGKLSPPTASMVKSGPRGTANKSSPQARPRIVDPSGPCTNRESC